MAYLARIESQDGQPIALPPLAPAKAEFSRLEWAIIESARLERLWTIRTPGPLRRFTNWLTNRGNPQLANPKLEALRRTAVLSWHFGFTVPGDDVADFLAAGFSPDQYELMVGCISAALNNLRRTAE